MGRKIKTLYEREQEELRELQRKMNTSNFKEDIGAIHRGDVFYFSKGYTVGVEQQGGRPGVVVSNDACNNSSEFLLVCYLTTQPKTSLPTHVPVMCEQPSTCLCEQIHTLSKEKMENYYCSLTSEEMAEIDKALMTTLGIDLNVLTPEEYNTMYKNISNLENEVEEQEKQIEKLKSELEHQINVNSTLVDKMETLKKEKADVSIENLPEYIKACTERDVYKELYKDLLASQK